MAISISSDSYLVMALCSGTSLPYMGSLRQGKQQDPLSVRGICRTLVIYTKKGLPDVLDVREVFFIVR